MSTEDKKPDGAKAATRDELSERARQRELERQADQLEAVAKANDDELPKLGGPLLEPGLGR